MDRQCHRGPMSLRMDGLMKEELHSCCRVNASGNVIVKSAVQLETKILRSSPHAKFSRTFSV